ncbi:MAG TPA: hypothetical protein VHB77_20025 [Planctomycetaceae bacterium]|nr:hypothetical protein [Planctomycetaceae bacterium]
MRVPRIDEALYAVPSLDAGLALADENRARLAIDLNLQGRPLSRLQAWSRQSVVQAASEYTAGWRDVGPLPAADRVFVSGHQPSLFHPGAWVKNFALFALARAAGAVSVNLVVDNDLLGAAAIRVPAGDADHPVVERIEFDDPRPIQPWEDAKLQNAARFDAFPNEVARAMAPWGFEPLLGGMWQVAVEQRQRSDRLVDCLTAARNSLEVAWGAGNLELPISRLSTLDPFLWFASHLLAHLPRFREIHNQVLHEYREINRIRSRTHPVADLNERAGWHEAPFWIWKAGDLQRSRLFAQQSGNEVLLSDGKGDVLARLPLGPEKEACCAVEVLRDMQQRGIHLRPRALTTTLFSRLYLAELFLHGIGGAKYDEMTDRLFARFYGITPPAFLTISATLQLPLPVHPVDANDLHRVERELRTLELNPATTLAQRNDPEIAKLIARESELLQDLDAAARGKTRSARRKLRSQRDSLHRELKDVRASLAAFTPADREQLLATRDRLQQQVQANAVLKDREYSVALFPESKIRGFMQRVMENAAKR